MAGGRTDVGRPDSIERLEHAISKGVTRGAEDLDARAMGLNDFRLREVVRDEFNFRWPQDVHPNFLITQFDLGSFFASVNQDLLERG